MNSIRYYEENADAFFQETVAADMSDARARFLARVPAGGRILDAGCGSGRDSLAFAQAGYQVVAFDASKELVQRARAHTGLPVLHMEFADVAWRGEFDGIWACASLLHVPAASLGLVLNQLAQALVPGGVLYGSFKYGAGETERGDRRFTNLDETALSGMLHALPRFRLSETWRTSDVRPGNTGQWLNFLAEVAA